MKQLVAFALIAFLTNSLSPCDARGQTPAIRRWISLITSANTLEKQAYASGQQTPLLVLDKFREALNLARSWGSEDPFYLVSLRYLSSSLYHLNRVGELRPLLEEDIALRKRLSPDFPELVYDYYLLGMLDLKSGALSMAQSEFNQALLISKEYVGIHRPYTCEILILMALVKALQGKDREAEQILNGAIEKQERKIPAGIFDEMSSLAMEIGSRPDVSLPALKFIAKLRIQGCNFHRSKFGPDESYLIMVADSVGFFWQHGMKEEATWYLGESVKLLDRIPVHDYRTLRCKAESYYYLAASGMRKPQDCMAIILSTLDIAKRSEDPVIRSTGLQVVSMYAKMLASLLPEKEQCQVLLRLNKTAAITGSGDRFNNLVEEADLLWRLGMHQQAKKHLKQCLQYLDEAIKDDKTILSQAMLAFDLARFGAESNASALKMLWQCLDRAKHMKEKSLPSLTVDIVIAHGVLISVFVPAKEQVVLLKRLFLEGGQETSAHSPTQGTSQVLAALVWASARTNDKPSERLAFDALTRALATVSNDGLAVSLTNPLLHAARVHFNRQEYDLSSRYCSSVDDTVRRFKSPNSQVLRFLSTELLIKSWLSMHEVAKIRLFMSRNPDLAGQYRRAESNPEFRTLYKAFALSLTNTDTRLRPISCNFVATMKEANEYLSLLLRKR